MLAEWITLLSVLSALPTLPPATQATLDKLSPRYESGERAVTNWRAQAARNLDLDESVARAFAEGGDPRAVGRCVKLNNYWCVKGAGWSGMLAADAEGHAAFASADEGAAVAALLLRRYYVEFSRRSATAIVTRWAPAQCGVAATISPQRTRLTAGASRVHTTPGPRGFRIQQTRRTLGPTPAANALATHGIGNTLRARYLAAAGRGPRLQGARGVRRSVVADAAPRRPAGLSPIDMALLPKSALSLVMLTTRPPLETPFTRLPSCSNDSERLRAYALKIIEGVAPTPDEDLHLFDAAGAPTDRLAVVMANMASVEIGPLKADASLILRAIDSATVVVKAATQGAAEREAATKADAAN